MKPLNLSQTKQARQKRLFSVFSLASLLFSLVVFCQIGQAQQQAQLSLADVLIGLRSKKVSLEDRNKILAEAVKVRGITFSLTPEIETELTAGGATGELVEAVRGKSAKIAAPVPVISAPDFAFYRKRADENHLKGDFDSALNDYNKAIELNPKDAATYFNRGRAYSNKKSYDLAVLDFDKTIELNPQDSSAYFNRAEIHERKGKTEQAAADYQKAVEFDATNESAKANLKRLQDEQAKNLAKQKEDEQAKVLAKQKEDEQAKILAKQKETQAAIVAEQPKVSESPAAPKTVELGSLIERAVKMVTPSYPVTARQLNINGQVTVQLTLDEQGNVTSAKAVSGPQFLRNTSEEAARNSKFKPAIANNEAIKATGFIVYNFTNKM